MKTAGILYTSLETILRKGRKGMLRVPEIQLAINVGISKFFENQLRMFRVSGYVPTPLTPLLTVTPIAITNGEGALPDDFAKEVSFYYPNAMNTKPAEFMNMAEFTDRQTSSILPATLYDPIGTIAGGAGGGTIYIRPIDLDFVTLTYIKRPTNVEIGTTISSGRFLIYDDDTTVDTELKPEYVNDILKEALLFLSVPEQDEMAAQYGSTNNNPQ